MPAPVRTIGQAVILACALVLAHAGVRARAFQAIPQAPATAVVLGQVVDGSSKAPIAGAKIILSSGARRETVLCDDEGRFAFTNLAAGNLSVSASMPGYAGGRFGQRYSNDGEQPLVLTDGERLADLRLPLWKMAVISGVVQDSHGDPLVGLKVRAFKRQFVSGAFRLTTDLFSVTLGTITDDRGAYRLSVAPGEYVVGVPSSDQQRGAAGYMAALSFSTTFFPSTLSTSAASVMALDSGEERGGINLRVDTAPARTISGTIVGAESSTTTPIQLTLARADAGEIPVDVNAAGATVATGRTFAFTNIAPGAYVIRAKAFPASDGGPVFNVKLGGSGFTATSGGGQPWVPGQPFPDSLDSSSWWASLPVIVDDKDLAGVTLTLQSGVRIRGRLQFEGQSTKPTVEELVSSLLLLAPIDGRERIARAGRVEADGRFQTAAVAPGLYEMMTLLRIRGWLLTSFTGAGRDLRESALEIGAEGIDDVVMRYTDAKMSDLSGQVSSADGKVRQDASIYVFTTDRRRWLHPTSSDMKELRPDRTGVYRTTLFPDREFFVAAIAGAVPEYWQRPEFLESLTVMATKFRSQAGGKQVVDLKVRDR